MAAYVMVDVAVTDPDAYRAYTERVPATLAPFGGRFLIRGGAVEVLEGAWSPHRVVVLAFPDGAAARAWHASPAYQEILPIRRRHAETRFLAVVEGVPED